MDRLSLSAQASTNTGQGNPTLGPGHGGALAHFRQMCFEKEKHFLIFPTGCASHGVDIEGKKVLEIDAAERGELLCKKQHTDSIRSKVVELMNDLAKEVRRRGKRLRRSPGSARTLTNPVVSSKQEAVSSEQFDHQS